MSLLQKASIITTPTAYAEDYLYSIKPAYALGSELVTQFDGVADGTDVTTLAGWAAYGVVNSRNVVDEKLVINISTGNTGAVFNFTTESDKKYLFTCNMTGNLGVGGVYIQSTNPSPFAVVYTNNLDISSGKINLVLSGLGVDSQIYFRAGANNAGITTYFDISVKEITDADFDFDRNSTGTRLNEDYLIEDVPYNLLRYTEAISTDFGVTDVTLTDNHSLSPSGTKTSTRAQLTNLGQSRAFNTITGSVVSGQSYTFSCHYKGTQGQTVYINALPVGGTEVSKAITLNGGWQRESVTFTAGSSSNYVYFVDSRKGGTATDFEVWGAQLVKGDQPKDYLKTTDRLDIPRIDYTNGEPSILLEPSRTNLETKSQDIANWGLVSNVTRTAGYTQSPEGLNNATRLQFTANGYTASFTQSNSTQYTLSCYAKRNDKGTQNFGFFTNGSGTVDSQFALTTAWQRFTYTYTSTNTSYAGLAGLSGADVSVYGMQVEAASYATSLIHTSGSTVTRSADSAYNAGNSDLISSTEGVLYVEASSNYDSSHTNRIAISDGTSSNRISLEWDETTENRIRVHLNTHSLLNYDAVDLSIQNKVAVKYAANDYAIWFNGREVVTQASGALPTGMNLLELRGVGLGAAGNFYGNTKSVMVFKEALTDLELEKLTGYNNHELYMNYYNRLSYLGLAEEYNVESDINNYIL